MNVTARISKELEFHLTGDVLPYIPARGPSYSSGGEPAEGGYAEDFDIEEITVSRGGKDVSILDNVDLKNPEVQKLLQNILTIFEDDVQEALGQAAADSEPDYGE